MTQEGELAIYSNTRRPNKPKRIETESDRVEETKHCRSTESREVVKENKETELPISRNMGFCIQATLYRPYRPYAKRNKIKFQIITYLINNNCINKLEHSNSLLKTECRPTTLWTGNSNFEQKRKR